MPIKELKKVPTPTISERPSQDNSVTLELLFNALKNIEQFLIELNNTQQFNQEKLHTALSIVTSAKQQEIFYSNLDNFSLLLNALENIEQFLIELNNTQQFNQEKLHTALSIVKSAKQQESFKNFNNQDYDDHDEHNS